MGVLGHPEEAAEGEVAVGCVGVEEEVEDVGGVRALDLEKERVGDEEIVELGFDFFQGDAGGEFEDAAFFLLVEGGG